MFSAFFEVLVFCFGVVMVDAFVDLSLEDDEVSTIQLGVEASDKTMLYIHYFFGTFLTLSGINFQAMKCTLANVWHPVGGVAISDLGNDRFLFRFFYEVDANRILMNGPWTFNSHLILHRLKEGKDPLLVPLFWVDF